MSEEIIPNDGRAIDINSPTAKSIIEGVIPKAIRTWTIFRNTNNTLEGIESVAFAMWQVALEEIEKESDHIVFMSDTTINLIRSNIKRLQAENERLKEENEAYKNSIIANHDRAIGKRLEEVLEENEELKAGLCKQCDFQKQYFSETKKLLAENERLKEQLSGKTFFCENCEKLARENEQLKKRQITKNGFICDCEQNVKYSKALEEIREIADEETNTDKLLHYKELRHYKNYCAILDIIQEVLG